MHACIGRREGMYNKHKEKERGEREGEREKAFLFSDTTLAPASALILVFETRAQPLGGTFEHQRDQACLPMRNN